MRLCGEYILPATAAYRVYCCHTAATSKSNDPKAAWGRRSTEGNNVVDHAESYVRGHVHTNGLENFWSLLKRGIKGTYVSVEPYHLFRYLDEQAFRFNERAGEDRDRFSKTLGRVARRRLTYDELIGKS